MCIVSDFPAPRARVFVYMCSSFHWCFWCFYNIFETFCYLREWKRRTQVVWSNKRTNDNKWQFYKHLHLVINSIRRKLPCCAVRSCFLSFLQIYKRSYFSLFMCLSFFSLVFVGKLLVHWFNCLFLHILFSLFSFAKMSLAACQDVTMHFVHESNSNWNNNNNNNRKQLKSTRNDTLSKLPIVKLPAPNLCLTFWAGFEWVRMFQFASYIRLFAKQTTMRSRNPHDLMHSLSPFETLNNRHKSVESKTIHKVQFRSLSLSLTSITLFTICVHVCIEKSTVSVNIWRVIL